MRGQFGLRLLLLAIAIVMPAAWAGDAAETPATTVELLTADTQVSADGSTVQTLHAEIRAGNDAGALQAGRIAVPFIHGVQDLDIVEAHTLKADGKTIPVDTGTIYEQLPQQDQQTGMITDRRIKLLLFPQFGAGDTAVYTLRYKTVHPYFPNTFYYAEIFPRQGAYKEVRVSVTAPTSMGLRVEAHSLQVAKKSEGANTVFSVHYSAPRPQQVDVAVVSPLDREPRFFLSSFKDYADLGRAYGALSQPKIVATDKVRALAAEITAGVTDRREQAEKIYLWVVKNIRYVAVELGQGSFTPHDADTVLANGYGDCKDHDILLQSLLKAKGIAAESVLINSSNTYTLTEAPTFLSLDHVITRLPEFDVYLDSNAPAPFGVLPVEEYGKPIVRISANGASAGTMPLVPPGLATITTRTVSHLDDKGTLTGTTTTTATGPYVIPLREFGIAVQAAGAQKSAEMLLAAHGYKNGTGKFTTDPPGQAGDRYAVTGEFSATGWSDWLTKGESGILPGGLRVFGVSGDGPMGTFYTSEPKDTEPTVCISARHVEDISLEIPAGYRFGTTPQDVKVETPHILFTAHWTRNGQVLAVHREFTSKMDKPLCTGAVRKEAADAIKKISDTYDASITAESASQASAPSEPQASTAPSEDETAYNQAKEAANKGDLKTAEKLLTGILSSGRALSPDQAFAVHEQLAYAYMRDNQAGRAVQELDTAIALKPDAGTEAYAMRASANSMLRKWKEAEVDWTVVLKANPEDVSLRRFHATAAAQAGDYAAAAEDYDYVAKASPNDVQIVLTRADYRMNARLYEAAADDFERAEKLGAPEQTVLEGLCQSLARTTRADEGAYQCSRALQVNSYGLKLIEARGIAYYRQGKYAEALADFTKASTTYPQSADYLYERGAAKIRTGDKAGGQKDVEAAKQKSPGIAGRMAAQKIVF